VNKAGDSISEFGNNLIQILLSYKNLIMISDNKYDKAKGYKIYWAMLQIYIINHQRLFALQRPINLAINA